MRYKITQVEPFIKDKIQYVKFHLDKREAVILTHSSIRKAGLDIFCVEFEILTGSYLEQFYDKWQIQLLAPLSELREKNNELLQKFYMINKHFWPERNVVYFAGFIPFDLPMDYLKRIGLQRIIKVGVDISHFEDFKGTKLWNIMEEESKQNPPREINYYEQADFNFSYISVKEPSTDECIETYKREKSKIVLKNCEI